jgi:hypothetical protein
MIIFKDTRHPAFWVVLLHDKTMDWHHLKRPLYRGFHIIFLLVVTGQHPTNLH